MFTTLHIIWTVALLVVFVGIVVWAFGRRQRDKFERAARSVLEDDGTSRSPHQPGDANHG